MSTENIQKSKALENIQDQFLPGAAGQVLFLINSLWHASPEKFVGVLAHELGHYINRPSDLRSR